MSGSPKDGKNCDPPKEDGKNFWTYAVNYEPPKDKNETTAKEEKVSPKVVPPSSIKPVAETREEGSVETVERDDTNPLEDSTSVPNEKCLVTNDIILGEKEKVYVEAVTNQLMEIGKKIVADLSFVETLMKNDPDVKVRCATNSTFEPMETGIPDSMKSAIQAEFNSPKLCSLSSDDSHNECPSCTCASQHQTMSNQNCVNEVAKCSLQQNGCLSQRCNGTKSVSSTKWLSELERNKKDFIEAFGRICYSMGQVGEKRCSQSSTSSCGTGSGKQQLNVSREVALTYTEEKVPQSNTGRSEPQVETSEANQMSERLRKLEAKFSCLNKKLEHVSRESGITRSNEVTTTENTAPSTSSPPDDRMCKLEQDINHMAKHIYELQACLQVQMHFGGLDKEISQSEEPQSLPAPIPTSCTPNPPKQANSEEDSKESQSNESSAKVKPCKCPSSMKTSTNNTTEGPSADVDGLCSCSRHKLNVENSQNKADKDSGCTCDC